MLAGMWPAANAFVVFYDGSCGICQCSRVLLERLRPEVGMDFVDVNDPVALARWPQIDPNAAQDEVFALTPSGQLHSGYEAAIVLLAAKTRWVSVVRRLLLLGPVRWIGGVVYRLISHHRHQLSRRLGLRVCKA